jgi:hypothetical protein
VPRKIEEDISIEAVEEFIPFLAKESASKGLGTAGIDQHLTIVVRPSILIG